MDPYADPYTDPILSVKFGEIGGLLEVQHTGMGFLYTKKSVYEKIQMNLKLPQCNEGLDRPPWTGLLLLYLS